jgi:hypothetical protein
MNIRLNAASTHLETELSIMDMGEASPGFDCGISRSMVGVSSAHPSESSCYMLYVNNSSSRVCYLHPLPVTLGASCVMFRVSS